MLKPPTPVDEKQRLATLQDLKLLDTEPEDRFDRVTRLAKGLFGTPIVLVSLVDAGRQWFKSRQGLDATETPRDISFCAHAILEDRTLVVNDARNDERFSDNPLVTSDPFIRFYAGYPLSAPDGTKAGTLCIIDREPREMTPEDLTLLRELGQMVEEELGAMNMVRNDPITGLANRAGFSLIAEHLLAMCKRTELPAYLMLFHCTNLKEIGDNLGRSEVDRAAVELSHLLLACFRDCDVVGRIATDLFAVMLASSNPEIIQKAQQRLFDALAQRNRDTNCTYLLEGDSHAVARQPDQMTNLDELFLDVQSLMHSAEDPTSVQTQKFG